MPTINKHDKHWETRLWGYGVKVKLKQILRKLPKACYIQCRYSHTKRKERREKRRKYPSGNRCTGYGQILHYLQYPIHHLPLVIFCSDSIYLLYLMTSKISITLVDLRAWIFYASPYWFSILHTLSPMQQNTTGYNEMITWRYQNYLFKNYLGFERRSETWEPFKSDKQLCLLWSQYLDVSYRFFIQPVLYSECMIWWGLVAAGWRGSLFLICRSGSLHCRGGRSSP